MKVSKHRIGHLNNSWKNIEGREISHINILSWTSSMIVSPINYFQTWSNYLKLDKEDNLMSYVWVYLYRSYIVMNPPTCGACYLESFASQNICTKREYCLCIQFIEPSFFHECPPYLPICGIYLPFQVNLHVPNSKPSNINLFCMPESLM